MSTNSLIGLLSDDGLTVKYVYCHWDGNKEHNGEILKKFYNTKNKLLNLIDNGISSVLSCLYKEDGSFDHNPTELNTFYPDISIEEYADKPPEYVYLFLPKTNTWTLLNDDYLFNNF
jgi:hypothetical protein